MNELERLRRSLNRITSTVFESEAEKENLKKRLKALAEDLEEDEPEKQLTEEQMRTRLRELADDLEEYYPERELTEEEMRIRLRELSGDSEEYYSEQELTEEEMKRRLEALANDSEKDIRRVNNRDEQLEKYLQRETKEKYFKSGQPIDRLELFDLLKRMCDEENYAIGIHGTKKINAKSILENGLNFLGRSSLATIKSFNDMTDEICEDVFTDYPHCGLDHNVVIACPKILENSANEKLYIGFPPVEVGAAARQYAPTSLFDLVVLENNYNIPREFILGCYEVDNGNSFSTTFVYNSHHYSNLSQHEKDRFFDKMKGLLDKAGYLSISDFVLNENLEGLERVKNLKQSFDNNDLDGVFETAINDLNKFNNKGQKRR